MAERRRIIEGTWSCAECDRTGIPGRLKRCPSCGAAREEAEATFDFGARTATGAVAADTVQDADALDLAAAGADWACAYCAASNRGDVDVCAACGAPREAEAPRASPPPPPRRRRWALVLLGVLGSFVLCCGGLGFWVTRTEALPGEVDRMLWQHRVVHERFVPHDVTGWRSDVRETPPRMPVDGRGEVAGAFDVRDCERREREPAACEDVVHEEACGTREVCEVHDLGNGFAEERCRDVPKTCRRTERVCHEAVYDDWCTWTTHAWEELEVRDAAGEGRETAWPDPPAVGRHDRVRREGRWIVEVTFGDEVWGVEEDDEAGFLTWHVGDPVLVHVNHLGMVREVTRVE